MNRYNVGDKVQIRHPNGSYGIIEAIRDDLPNGPRYYVRFHYGTDARGEQVTDLSGLKRADELQPVSDAEWQKQVIEHRFNSGRTVTVTGRFPSEPEEQNITPRDITPGEKLSVHQLIGFDEDVNAAWQGALGATGSLLHALAGAAGIKSAKPMPGGKNPRMQKLITAQILSVVREAVRFGLAFNAEGTPKPGMEAAAAKERAALKKLLAQIESKIGAQP